MNSNQYDIFLGSLMLSFSSILAYLGNPEKFDDDYNVEWE